jgi:hypothetical protein
MFVALPVTLPDCPQLTKVGHDHFMAKLLQSFVDPDSSGFKLPSRPVAADALRRSLHEDKPAVRRRSIIRMRGYGRIFDENNNR